MNIIDKYLINTFHIYKDILEIIYSYTSYSDVEHNLIFRKILLKYWDEANGLDTYGGIWYKNIINKNNKFKESIYFYHEDIKDLKNETYELMYDRKFNKDIFIYPSTIPWHYNNGKDNDEWYTSEFVSDTIEPFIMQLEIKHDKKLTEVIHKLYTLEDLYKRDKYNNKSLLFYLAKQDYHYIEEIVNNKDFNFNELFLEKNVKHDNTSTVFINICKNKPELAMKIIYNNQFNAGILKKKEYLDFNGTFQWTPLEVLVYQNINNIIKLIEDKIIDHKYIIYSEKLINYILWHCSNINNNIVLKIFGCKTNNELYTTYIIEYIHNIYNRKRRKYLTKQFKPRHH